MGVVAQSEITGNMESEILEEIHQEPVRSSSGTQKRKKKQSRRKREKARKAKSIDAIRTTPTPIPCSEIKRGKSNTLSRPAKERKIEGAVKLWASGSSLPTSPKKPAISETLLSSESPFPGIPVFSEEDVDLEARTELKHLLKIEQTFKEWSGEDISKPKRRSMISFRRKKASGRSSDLVSEKVAL